MPQKDAIAESLKQGEVCKRDLKDTTSALHDCIGGASDSNAVIHFLEGSLVGAALTLIVVGLWH